jgi:outer membrane beta-barrel protein
MRLSPPKGRCRPSLLVALPLMGALALFSSPALAQDDAEARPDELLDEEYRLVRPPNRAPREGTPLIADKLYPMQYRLEFTGMFDFTYADKYVRHYGGHGSIGFHLFDWLAFEVYAGYLGGRETNIADKVRLAGKSNTQLRDDPSLCATPSCEPELPDLWQTTWIAGANVQWAPIYGKLSAVSELDMSFQLYGILGGGVEGIRKKLNTPDAAGGPMFEDGGVRPVVNYGLGLRVMPWKWVALRAELRNYTGINPGVPEQSNACDIGYTLQVGQETRCNRDFSNTAMVQLGLSFVL